MKQITTIPSLIRDYCINDIEKHLIYYFLETNGISFRDNEYLSDYYNGYTIDDVLLKKISLMNHVSIEDITNDMGLLMPSSDKQLNGAFFTPKYIVDYIIETVRPSNNSVCADISCGSGAFIIGLLRYFGKEFGKSVHECLKNNIYGGDVLDYNVRRCKLLIIIFGLMNGESIHEDEINISLGDSLKKNWNNKFDIIVGNPPYVKFQDLDEENRAFLLNNWETTRLGTYNLYFAFFEAGYKLLKQNGRLGYITPNNYFTSLSGEPLRAYFQNNQCIYKIIDFSSKKVFDVQTYTAITFLNKKKNLFIEFDRISDSESPIDFIRSVSSSKNYYRDLNVKKWRLLCDDEKHNIHCIENSGKRLNELFDISVGIATLKDDAFTFVPTKEDSKYYYVIHEGTIYSVEKGATRPLVKISEIKAQKDLASNRKRIVFPYIIDDNNKPQLIPEDEFKKRFPRCYDYLLTKREILANRGKGNHVYDPFFKYGRVQSLNKFGIKLLTPTFSQFPRFIFDRTSDGLFTNGYAIYPRKAVYRGLFQQDLISLEENFDVLQRILNSIVMHYYVKTTSVSIEGGYPCYQKNFIERFTIPDFSQEEIDMLRNMPTKEDVDIFLIKRYHVNLPEPNRCS